MKIDTINLITGIVLLVFGLWGAYGASSPTAYIAPAFGAILLILHPGFIKEQKLVSHIVVGLTALVAIMLIVPFIRNLGTGDIAKMIRIGVMFLVALWATIKYIGYFRAQRKAKAEE